MADIILEWTNIIGKNKAGDKGYAGDLLAVGLDNIKPFIDDGSITQETAATIVAQTIDSSIKNAMQFEKENKMFELSRLSSAGI